jgi:glycosidase
MKNFRNPTDAEVRRDFPGGFAGDADNKFTHAGRTVQENEAFDYFSKLALYRKSTPALYDGKLVQFLPVDGVYVYFRFNANKTIMIATNSMPSEKIINTDRFADLLGQLKLGAMRVVVLELEK